jgi:hypothetical protein
MGEATKQRTLKIIKLMLLWILWQLLEDCMKHEFKRDTAPCARMVHDLKTIQQSDPWLHCWWSTWISTNKYSDLIEKVDDTACSKNQIHSPPYAPKISKTLASWEPAGLQKGEDCHDRCKHVTRHRCCMDFPRRST